MIDALPLLEKTEVSFGLFNHNYCLVIYYDFFFKVISKFDIEWEMLIFSQLIFTSQQTYELMQCLEELTTEYKLGRKKDGLVDIAISLKILQNWLFI